MKKSFGISVLVFVLLFILGIPLAAAELSPAFSVLAKDITMNKTGLTAADISFSETDFTQALADGDLTWIQIVELPRRTDGILKCMGIPCSVGQQISREYLNKLSFTPASAYVDNASFQFSSSGSEAAMTCDLHMISRVNAAPAIDTLLPTMTLCRDYSLFGTLSASDPEGDLCTFFLVKAPEKGSVSIDGNCYCYTPMDGKTGSDTFTYVAADSYGNYSAPADVTVNIVNSAVLLKDMEGQKSGNAAAVLCRAAILKTADSCFYPNKKISRIDFLSSAMKACGTEFPSGQYQLNFSDCNSLTEEQIQSLGLAVRMGIVSGSQNKKGELCFRPDDAISGPEAALIVSRLSGVEMDDALETSLETDSVPTWAIGSVNTMRNAIGYDCPSITASALTRADAASLLYFLYEYPAGQIEKK